MAFLRYACVVGLAMATFSWNMEDGLSPAAKGWFNIANLENAAGVSHDGSYALRVTGGAHDTGEGSMPTPAMNTGQYCLSFDWKFIEHWEFYGVAHLRYLNPNPIGWLQIGPADQGNTKPDLYVYSAGGEVLIVPDFWPIDNAWRHVRFEVQESSADYVTQDGILRVWWSDSIGSPLVLRGEWTNIAGMYSPGPGLGLNHTDRVHWSPMGLLDNLVVTDALCSTALTPIPEDVSAATCCTVGRTASTGGAVAPTVTYQPWTPSCTGGGAVPTAATPASPETW